MTSNGKGRVLVGVLISGCAAAALVGCSSNSSSSPTSSAPPEPTVTRTETKTATASPSASNPSCTVAALQSAMTGGKALAVYCADGYAVVQASPDATPVFKSESGKWVSTGLDCLTSAKASLAPQIYADVCTNAKFHS